MPKAKIGDIVIISESGWNIPDGGEIIDFIQISIVGAIYYRLEGEKHRSWCYEGMSTHNDESMDNVPFSFMEDCIIYNLTMNKNYD